MMKYVLYRTYTYVIVTYYYNIVSLLFNRCINEGLFPDAFKKAKLTNNPCTNPVLKMIC